MDGFPTSTSTVCLGTVASDTVASTPHSYLVQVHRNCAELATHRSRLWGQLWSDLQSSDITLAPRPTPSTHQYQTDWHGFEQKIWNYVWYRIVFSQLSLKNSVKIDTFVVIVGIPLNWNVRDNSRTHIIHTYWKGTFLVGQLCMDVC